MIEFVVHGIPAPQGSKNAWGGEDNPRTKPWRGAVAAAAADALDGRPLLTGPLQTQVVFTFPRPKAHYGTGRNAQTLKASAPYWCTGTPDLDKLARAVGDALTGVAIRDDAQIAVWTITKRYGEHAHAAIRIGELNDDANREDSA